MIKIFLLVSCLFVTVQAGAKKIKTKESIVALTPETVVRKSLKFYPVVVNAVLDLKASKLKENALRGSFDTKIKGDIDSRFDGYYTGDAYKAQIEKQFPFLNSKLYGGFRDSSGSFPSYEGKFETLSGGESFVGFSFSLLRDSLIDSDRLNVSLASEDIKQSELKLDLVKLKVQTLALTAYWNWVASVGRVRVYQEILDLARVRMKGIKRRIQKGDLAKIYKAENRQYIVKRQAQLEKAKYLLYEATLFLSLFNRNSKGEPVLPMAASAPDLNGIKHPKSKYSNELFERVLTKNLETKVFDSKLNQLDLKLKQSRFQMLPKLDLNFEINEDSGSGAPELAGQEHRFLLKFEFPLENRKARGKRDVVLAETNIYKNKRSLLVDELRRDLNALVLKINTSSTLIDITKEQVELAKKLVAAEQRKFDSGASDLILLNLREELFAESKIKNLQTLLDYFTFSAKLNQMKVELIVD